MTLFQAARPVNSVIKSLTGNNMKIQTFSALSIAAIMLCGCADGNYRPYNLDDRWGQSQQQALRAQIADPQAAENPLPDSPRKMDGYAGVNTMRTYRDGFGQNVQPQGLTINIGGGTGGGSGSGGQ
jgi:cell division protein ZapA (FtsZ GTPase activity inhibitor)